MEILLLTGNIHGQWKGNRKCIRSSLMLKMITPYAKGTSGHTRLNHTISFKGYGVVTFRSPVEPFATRIKIFYLRKIVMIT